MMRIKHNLWTDGKDEYTGNPKDGFVKITKTTKKPKEDTVVEVSAFELKQPSVVKETKKEVDTDPEE